MTPFPLCLLFLSSVRTNTLAGLGLHPLHQYRSTYGVDCPWVGGFLLIFSLGISLHLYH
ncbi:hypothetical protein BP00DRAFT_423859 [Aspergillus indologenus CBS 114.80]|uniref:Uncharacterized protein n=1 Tax=Aspergillus indologenus CBS 114.80 TaxID=1450541 RepID=A0A2V5IXR9_9EURO|nr:hypothetical protein BP00DRAFT_423859 [Aspergillus indologenus CBS 114.80]